jgi:hypothetical protein
MIHTHSWLNFDFLSSIYFKLWRKMVAEMIVSFSDRNCPATGQFFFHSSWHVSSGDFIRGLILIASSALHSFISSRQDKFFRGNDGVGKSSESNCLSDTKRTISRNTKKKKKNVFKQTWRHRRTGSHLPSDCLEPFSYRPVDSQWIARACIILCNFFLSLTSNTINLLPSDFDETGLKRFFIPTWL